MIIVEKVIFNNKEFVRTYSDAGYMVERDGIRYAEAVDPVGFDRVYIETDELIEIPEVIEEEEAN